MGWLGKNVEGGGGGWIAWVWRYYLDVHMETDKNLSDKYFQDISLEQHRYGNLFRVIQINPHSSRRVLQGVQVLICLARQDSNKAGSLTFRDPEAKPGTVNCVSSYHRSQAYEPSTAQACWKIFRNQFRNMNAPQAEEDKE
jgi:hypothetical protein